MLLLEEEVEVVVFFVLLLYEPESYMSSYCARAHTEKLIANKKIQIRFIAINLFVSLHPIIRKDNN
jgi:hypothetical protein